MYLTILTCLIYTIPSIMDSYFNWGEVGFHTGDWLTRIAPLVYLSILVNVLRKDRISNFAELIYTRPINASEYYFSKLVASICALMTISMATLALLFVIALTRQPIGRFFDGFKWAVIIPIPSFIAITALAFAADAFSLNGIFCNMGLVFICR